VLRLRESGPFGGTSASSTKAGQLNLKARRHSIRMPTGGGERATDVAPARDGSPQGL